MVNRIGYNRIWYNIIAYSFITSYRDVFYNNVCSASADSQCFFSVSKKTPELSAGGDVATVLAESWT